MVKAKYIDQNEINKIWRKEWLSLKNTNLQDLFKQRLFIEGYPVFKKYIPKDTKSILDAGGGTGRYGIKIAQDFPKSNVVISDILEESLNLGKQIAEELNIQNVQFMRDDILNSSFPDNHFDVVLCDVVLQHLPHYGEGIKQIKRITKPGGVILISAVNYWNFHTAYKKIVRTFGPGYEYEYEKSFSIKELSKILNEMGGKVVATDGFYVGYGLFRLKKYHRAFYTLGRVVNRLAKILDKFTYGFFSKHFGFEIVVVATKT